MRTTRRRALLVTSGFPPAMPADVQRVRMLGYDIGTCGWDVEILAPGPGFQRPDAVEERSRALRPADVAIHEPGPWCASFFRALGSRSIGWRALVPMHREGSKILARGTFDLVYISTTAFPLFCLGRIWAARFGVPYVLDFQDPWYRPDAAYETSRHSFKVRVSRWLSKFLEAWVLKRASGLVAVSPAYLEQLAARYPGCLCTQPDRRAVIPFAASEIDLAAARAVSNVPGAGGQESVLNLVYTGAGGAIMAKAFARIAGSLARLRQSRPELAARVRIRLYGTDSDWRPGQPRMLQQMAEGLGLSGVVEEFPARVGYLEALHHVLAADGLIVLGVDDPAYMPSKLFTYVLARKPMLACLHARSQANRYFEQCPDLGYVLHFEDGTSGVRQSGDPEMEAFLQAASAGFEKDRSAEIAGFLSPNAARRHADLFEACLK